MQVVMMLASIGGNTSSVPTVAACLMGSPIRIFLEIFSATIMASSTTIPKTIITADRVTTLMLYPIKYVTITVILSEKGMPKATQNPARLFKKTISSKKIRAMPTNPFEPTMPKRFRKLMDSSSIKVIA